jgi:hypothetical protein
VLRLGLEHFLLIISICVILGQIVINILNSMKSLILSLLASAILLPLGAQGAAAPSGQITFVTDNGSSSNFVLDTDNSTRLTGSGFWGQLYVGLDIASIQAVGVATEFGANGAGAGFLVGNPVGVTWSGTVNSVAMPVGDQSGVYVLRAWAGAVGSTYENALVRGQSGVVNNVLVGNQVTFGGIKPNGDPAGSFAFSNAHGSFALAAVPEPATIALGIFGAAGLLIRRRK